MSRNEPTGDWRKDLAEMLRDADPDGPQGQETRDNLSNQILESNDYDFRVRDKVSIPDPHSEESVTGIVSEAHIDQNDVIWVIVVVNKSKPGSELVSANIHEVPADDCEKVD